VNSWCPSVTASRPVPRLLSLAFASLLFAGGAWAQSGTVSGRVTDGTEPIPSATIALWRTADSTLVTGSISGPDGRFRAEAVPAGAYEAVVSFVGYEDHVAEITVGAGETVQLGTVALRADVAALDAVDVTAARQAVSVQADRTAYSFEDDPIVAGGTAADLLEQVPAVDVDIDGNITFRNAGNVTVLINGRPAPIPPDLVGDYLRQLPADAVLRVEVIPAPSARYEPDGTAGILNIVLREDADPGFGGTLSLTGDSRGSTGATGLASYGRGPWTLAADYALRRDLREAGRTTLRINRGALPETLRDEIGVDDRERLSNRLGLRAEYAFTRRTALRAQGSVRHWRHAEDQALDARFSDASGAALGTSARRVADDETRLGTDLRLGLRHAFDADGDHRLDLEARVDRQDRERHENIAEAPNGTDLATFQERETRLDRIDRRVGFDADYVRPGLGGRLEAGYSFFVRLQERDFVSQSRGEPGAPLAPDVGLTNASEYGLWIHAVYGQWARTFGQVDVQAGLRLETALTDFEVIGQPEAFQNRYASAFPSVFGVYRINDENSLRAGYSRRVTRPRTDHQNPFPRFDDPLNVYVGNPDIRPEFTDALEASYVRFLAWGSLQVGPYARRTTDRILYVVRVREDGVTERTVANLATTQTFGGEGVLAFDAAGDRLRGTLSLDAFHISTDGEAAGTTLARDSFGWGGRASLGTTFSAFGLQGTALQVSARYRAGMQTEQGRSRSFLFTDLALRQPLLADRATLSLRVRDPLGTARAAWILDQPLLYQETERDWGAQRVQLTLQLRFNQPDRQRGPAEENGGPPGPNPEPEF
jgi:iron complex outermembrane recepter protein